MIKTAEKGPYIFKFWHYQLLGWTLFLLLQYANDHLVNLDKTKNYFTWFIVTYTTIFIIILIIRLIYKRLYRTIKNPGILILIVLLASSICSVLWVEIRIIILYLIYPEGGYQELIGITGRAVERILMGVWVPFVWSVLYFGIKFWQDMIVERQRTKDAVFLAQKAQLHALRYQLNPHFLFNSLNSIQALFRENPDQADLMIIELSDFLRYSLKYNEIIMIPVREEIDIINKYLTIEKIRYEEKLDFSINVDNNAKEIEIPCFITQPLVENSIKHGLYKNPGGIKIRVNVQFIHDLLRMEVVNTGKLPQEWDYGVGLKNVIDRLENSYKDRFDFSLTETESGVSAKFEILMEDNEKANFPVNR